MDIRSIQPGLVWITEGNRTVPISVKELAALLDVTTQTVNRWARQSNDVPRVAVLAIRHCVLGLICHPDWEGYGFDEDFERLYPPNSREGIPRGAIEHLSSTYETNRLMWQDRERKKESEREKDRRESLMTDADFYDEPETVAPLPEPPKPRLRLIREREARPE